MNADTPDRNDVDETAILESVLDAEAQSDAVVHLDALEYCESVEVAETAIRNQTT